MDLNNFLKTCHEKVNLHPDFILSQCDSSTVSYIQPFCLSGVEKPIIGYIYVSMVVVNIFKSSNTIFCIHYINFYF